MSLEAATVTKVSDKFIGSFLKDRARVWQRGSSKIASISHHSLRAPLLISGCVPNQKPALMTLIIFAFQAAWNIQTGTVVFQEQYKTLPTVVTQAASSGMARAGVAMAAAVFLLIPPIIVFMAAQKQVIETMAHSGIKE